MKDQIAVLGIGRFGYSLATTLFDMGHDVLAMDTDKRRVNAISSHVTHAVQGDCTSESVLRELGINDFKIAIVAMGSVIETSVLTTLLLKNIGVEYVIARAVNDLHADILHKIGADKVVLPQRDTGREVAHGVILTDVTDYMLVTRRYGISKLNRLPFLVNRSLQELGFGRKAEHDAAVLLIERHGEIIISPSEKEVVRLGDMLIVAAEDEKLAKLLANAKKKSAY